MKTLEVVALTTDVSEKHLRRGQVGTVVEILAPGMVEVEFSDLDGNTYAMCAIPESSLMVLHHIPDAIAAQYSRPSGVVEKVLTNNVAGFIAIVDARKLDYYNMLEAEHAGYVLLDEAKTALGQLLAGQRVTTQELTKALSAQ